MSTLEKVDSNESTAPVDIEVESSPLTSAQPDTPARAKLTLKDKAETPREQAEGPVIKIRKNRAAQAKAGAILVEGAYRTKHSDAAIGQ